MKMTLKIFLINFFLLTSFLFILANRDKPWEKIKFPPLKKISQPDIHIFKLKNGMKLFFLKDNTLPEVKVAIFVKAGEFASPDGKYGLSTITFDLLRSGGNKKYTSDDFDEEVDLLGASIVVNVKRDMAEIDGVFLSEDLKKGVDLLSCMLKEPVFEEDKIEVEKNKIKGIIARRNDDPSTVATREFKKLVYGNNPLTREIEYSDLENIKREDILSFYDKYVVPKNIYIGIYGNFDENEAKKYIEDNFDNWNKRGYGEKVPEVRESNKRGVFLIDKPEVNQSNIRIGHIGIKRNNPDYVSVLVLDNILGTNSFSSRLVEDVRTKRGLAYSVGGGIFSAFEYPGVFMIYCGTKTESTAMAISSIIEEIKKIREKNVSERELEDAKNSFLNSFVFEFADGFDYLRREMELDFWGYPLDFYSKIFEKIKSVSIADVKKVAEKYIHPERLKILVVGKGNSLESSLSKFGVVKKIDIRIHVPEDKILKPQSENLEKGKSVFKEIMASLGFTGKRITGYREKSEGKIFQNGMSVGKVEITTVLIFPDKIFVETKFPMGTLKTVFTGKVGYRELMGKRQNLSEREKKSLLSVFNRDLIYISTLNANRNFKVWYTGKRKFLGKKYESLRVKFKNGNFFDIFYSYKNGEVKMEGISYRENNENGEALVERKIVEFSIKDGIKVPVKFKVFRNGVEFGEFRNISFEINPEDVPVELKNVK